MDQPAAKHAKPAESANTARYEALLAEAARIHGVSLWMDAWRRLRKNWAAMVSLGFLILLGILAFFTPVLPLQSPRFQRLDTPTSKDQFQPPNLRPVTLALTLDEVRQHEREVADLEQKLREASAREREPLEAALIARHRDHPFNRLWTSPGPLARRLIRLRMTLFGQGCIPSICGTDELGRDVLSRIFWGSRVSLIVGIVATLVSLAIGVTYGAIAGYVGGAVDAAMMRVVDVMYSIPFIFVVIFLITVLSEDSIKSRLEDFGIGQITVFYFVIGAFYWLTMSRVVRGQVISLKHEQFIDAARTSGAGTGRIIFRHLIPNVLGIVIVYLTLTIPSVMLFEAFLSFLGLGVQAPDVSWGVLMDAGIRAINPIQKLWWLVLFPGLALALTLFALNFLGDGLRDALDPRMKNR
ncbi:MAG: ABC transporter permease [Planctomycetaceae bacterium]|nr:ABC transporter permease [Planctomycetaceae bacterium]